MTYLGVCPKCGHKSELAKRVVVADEDGSFTKFLDEPEVMCNRCAGYPKKYTGYLKYKSEDFGIDNDELDALLAGMDDEDDEDDETSRPKLRVLDMQHMLSTPPPPVMWLAEPLVIAGSVTLLAGREGLGKSMLALALAAAIGRADTVAGIKCSPGRVLYVDAENGQSEAHRRIHGLKVRGNTLVYADADGFDLRRDFGEVEALVGEHEPSVLILDSLRSLAPGLEENDSKDTEAALRPVVRFAQRMGIATLILHHAGKNGHEYRGSTAIGAAVELGFTMARSDEDPDERVKLTCWKCRPAAKPAARWLKLRSEGERIVIGEAEPFEPTHDAPVRDDVAADLRDYLHGVPGATRHRGVGTLAPSWSTADLAREIGRGPKDGTVRRALDRLAADGVLHRGDDRRWRPLGEFFHTNGNGSHA